MERETKLLWLALFQRTIEATYYYTRPENKAVIPVLGWLAYALHSYPAIMRSGQKYLTWVSEHKEPDLIRITGFAKTIEEEELCLL